MGITIPLLIGATVVGGASVYEQERARKSASSDAAKQREALAALQAQGQPSIPTQDAARAARRASITQQMRRRGRSSTILTGEPSDTLGGGGV